MTIREWVFAPHRHGRVRFACDLSLLTGLWRFGGRLPECAPQEGDDARIRFAWARPGCEANLQTTFSLSLKTFRDLPKSSAQRAMSLAVVVPAVTDDLKSFRFFATIWPIIPFLRRGGIDV